MLFRRIIRAIITLVVMGILITSVYFKYAQGVDIPISIALLAGAVSGYFFADGTYTFSTPAFTFRSDDQDEESND